ncbi:MAG: hypothetical protein QGI36_01365 [Candidatus Thalassarchaeaceae archaeon]|nr:hypothetical protein [Candidatus Thalassarchaeaceae archaeon]HJM87468.1 hypothetical protein [Candidatus Thalassarchaeaceae archaeon]
MSFREIRLDASGILRLKIESISNPRIEPFWVSGSDPVVDIPKIMEISHLSMPIQAQILRLTEVLCADNPLSGPLCVRGFVAASSQGCVGLANSFLDAWLAGNWTSRQEARARAVIRSYSKRLRNGLLPERVVKPGLLNVSDLPASMAPFIVRYRNWLRIRQEWLVISGGDRLSPGFWIWSFDECGIGEVIGRLPPSCNLIESLAKIGIHLNHPRVAKNNGHLYYTR